MENDATAAAPAFQVVIVMPVYRDWDCAWRVCRELDRPAAKDAKVRIILIDDGSPDGLTGWTPFHATYLAAVDVLRLHRNMGHQRAIALALCYIFEHAPCDAVLVMDADGEDRPEDALRLIDLIERQPDRIFFAQRRKRLETPVFRLGYWMFRLVHRALTGVTVRVGNFSVLPFPVLARLVRTSELWNHYAGAVLKSKLPFEPVPMDRGKRLIGQSRMNGVALVAHGIAGIATFYDVVATRILLTSIFSMALLILFIAIIVGIRLETNLAIPGWATYTTGLLIIVLAQVVTISFSLVFSLISGRGATQFIPIRDYAVFVAGAESLWKPQS